MTQDLQTPCSNTITEECELAPAALCALSLEHERVMSVKRYELLNTGNHLGAISTFKCTYCGVCVGVCGCEFRTEQV